MENNNQIVKNMKSKKMLHGNLVVIPWHMGPTIMSKRLIIFVIPINIELRAPMRVNF